tara:strand:+ start:6884 stop:7096 length:213 start_codon:yes stop_codon:yes gene_type:complete
MTSNDRSEARRAYDRVIRTSERHFGPVVDALVAAGGDDLLHWLVASTPKGATISETLAAVALDAMHDEKG